MLVDDAARGCDLMTCLRGSTRLRADDKQMLHGGTERHDHVLHRYCEIL